MPLVSRFHSLLYLDYFHCYLTKDTLHLCYVAVISEPVWPSLERSSEYRYPDCLNGTEPTNASTTKRNATAEQSEVMKNGDAAALSAIIHSIWSAMYACASWMRAWTMADLLSINCGTRFNFCFLIFSTKADNYVTIATALSYGC